MLSEGMSVTQLRRNFCVHVKIGSFTRSLLELPMTSRVNTKRLKRFLQFWSECTVSELYNPRAVSGIPRACEKRKRSNDMYIYVSYKYVFWRRLMRCVGITA